MIRTLGIRPAARRLFVLLLAVTLAASGPGLGASATTVDAVPVRTLPVEEISPAGDGGWFAWARNTEESPDFFTLFVRRGDAPRVRVNPRGTDSRGGGIDGRTVVFTMRKADRTFGTFDLYTFDVWTRRRTRLPDVVNTAANEYDPTISGKWVLFGQMAEPRSRIVLFNRRTGTVRRVVSRFAMLWPGQVNGVYATWEGRQQFRYHIPSGTNRSLPVLDGTYQHSPAVSADGTVYVCRVPRDGRRQEIVRHVLGHPATVLHRLPEGRGCRDLFVKDRLDGARVVFFGSFPVEGGVNLGDIYKAVDR